jgi:CobQ-like glutamine amidotransferase family enzyme
MMAICSADQMIGNWFRQAGAEDTARSRSIGIVVEVEIP